MRIVVSLGGNSLLLRGERPTAERVRLNIMHAAHILYRLVASGHQLVITHACGPQVDKAASQSVDTQNPTPLARIIHKATDLV